MVGLDLDCQIFSVASEDQAFGDGDIFAIESGEAKDTAPLFFEGEAEFLRAARKFVGGVCDDAFVLDAEEGDALWALAVDCEG